MDQPVFHTRLLLLGTYHHQIPIPLPMRLRIHQLDNPLIPIQPLEELHLIDVSPHCLLIDLTIQPNTFERIDFIIRRDDFVDFRGPASANTVYNSVFEFVALSTTSTSFSRKG